MNQMIWCVDDDDTIRGIELYALEQTGFQARGFANGNEMFEALDSELPDLIVLDVMLPGDDGIDILKKLKAEKKHMDIPVIMATAKGTEMDAITGLNLGADDYLVKPFGIMELIARVKAVLRRKPKEEYVDNSTIGMITLKKKEHKVFVNGEKIELTNKEFELLSLFMQNPEIVLTRETIMNRIWGADYVGETRTVDMHIKTLRHKLKDAAQQIKTVIGVGYVLEEEV